MEGLMFISPSQEEIFEARHGRDGVLQQAGKISDETPSQPNPDLDIELSTSPSSLQRVFDVTGSTPSTKPSQEVVEFVSPPTPEEDAEAEIEAEALSPRALRDDSAYNEAFESDRSQSPSRRLSWGVGVAANANGCCKDFSRSPSPFSGAAAVLEEIEGPIENHPHPIDEATTSDGGKMVRSWQPGLPSASSAMELSLAGGEAAAAFLPQLVAEASAKKDNGQPEEGLQTADVAIPLTSASPGGVGGIDSPRFPRLPLDNKGVENPSTAAQGNFEAQNGPRVKKMGETCSSAAADDNPATTKTKAGSMVKVSAPLAAAAPAAADNSKSLTLNIEANRSKDNSERRDRNFFKDDRLSSRDKNQGINSEAEPVFVLTSGPQNDPAVGERRGIDPSISKDKSSEDKIEDPQIRPSVPFGGSSVGMVDIADTGRAVDNSEVMTGIAKDGGQQQQRHRSPPRPPPAVQAKLDRLRSRRGKNVCIGKSTADITDGGTAKITDRGRFRQPRSLPDDVMSAIKVRSGEKFAGRGRALPNGAEFLQTAINVGIFPAQKVNFQK